MKQSEQQIEIEKAESKTKAEKKQEEKQLTKRVVQILGKEPSGSMKVTKKSSNPLIQRYYDSQNFRIFLTFFLLIILFATTLLLSYLTIKIKENAPKNFEECKQLEGSVIQESYPAVCVTKSGERFTQELTEEEKEFLEAGVEKEMVKGVTNPPITLVSPILSCLETEGKLLEDIVDCEEISERECVELKAEFDSCILSCKKELGEKECYKVCKPVCDKP